LFALYLFHGFFKTQECTFLPNCVDGPVCLFTHGDDPLQNVHHILNDEFLVAKGPSLLRLPLNMNGLYFVTFKFHCITTLKTASGGSSKWHLAAVQTAAKCQVQRLASVGK
jgi:hypothetical protein